MGREPVVVLVGADGAGKTTLIERFCEQEPETRTAYMGENEFSTRIAASLHGGGTRWHRLLFARYAYPRDLKRRTKALEVAHAAPLLIDRWPMFPFQPGTPIALRTRYTRALTHPDMMILLDGDAQTLHQRKPEGPPEALERNLVKARHLLLSGVATEAVTLDAAASLDDNLDALRRRIDSAPTSARDVPGPQPIRSVGRPILHVAQAVDRTLAIRMARRRALTAARIRGRPSGATLCGGLDETCTFRVKLVDDSHLAVKAVGAGAGRRLLRKRQPSDLVKRRSPRARLVAQADVLRRLHDQGAAPAVLGSTANATVMEWVQGKPLIALGPTERRAALSRIAGKAQRMHEAGIIHGDLHVDNIMITDDGDARFLDPEPDTARNRSAADLRAFDAAMLFGSVLPLQPESSDPACVRSLVQEHNIVPLDALQSFAHRYARHNRYIGFLNDLLNRNIFSREGYHASG